MATILQERKWGRARESEEKIGQHGVAMKLDGKRRGAFLLRERARETPLACSPSGTHARGGLHSRGAHFRRGGALRREIKVKGGGNPLLVFKHLLYGPRGAPKVWGPPQPLVLSFSIFT
jgi:hypothetical protein